MGLSRARLLTGSPLGREFLSGYLGPAGVGLPRLPGPFWWRQVRTKQVRAVLRAGLVRGRWRAVLAGQDELGLLADLAEVTFPFGFSGEGEEWLWAETVHAERELLPVAEALVQAPGARQWWRSADRDDQRFLEWDEDAPRLKGPAVEQAVRDGMRAERARNQEGLKRGRPRDPDGGRVGAHWWSAPDFAAQTWTTGGFGDIPTIALGQFVDTLTPFEETGATVWSLRISPDARVLEITAPSHWQALVARFPRDVTGTHDGEWRDWGGVAGPWRLPDWEQVMGHYDGVHVTIGGYLASCGLALPAAGGYTLLAGWIPDATLWLRDVTTRARRLGRWHGNPQDGPAWDEVNDGWTPAGPSAL